MNLSNQLIKQHFLPFKSPQDAPYQPSARRRSAADTRAAAIAFAAAREILG